VKNLALIRQISKKKSLLTTNVLICTRQIPEIKIFGISTNRFKDFSKLLAKEEVI
jgi:hypothetical protein